MRIVSLKRMSTPADVRLGGSEMEGHTIPYHIKIKMAATGKRKILTLDDRVDVLKRIDNVESCRSIATAVNCGKTQISRIRNDRPRL